MPFQKVIVLENHDMLLLIVIKIRFLGGKLGKALAGEYDVSTVGDLL